MTKDEILVELEKFYKLSQTEKNLKMNFNITLNILHQVINNPELFEFLDSTELADKSELHVFYLGGENIKTYISIVSDEYKNIIEIEDLESRNHINAKYVARNPEDFSFVITDNSEFEEGTLAVFITPTWSSNAIIKNRIEKKESFKYVKLGDNNKFKLTSFDQNKMASYIFTGNWSQSLDWYNELMKNVSSNLDYTVDGVDFYTNITMKELYEKISKYNLKYDKKLEAYATQTMPVLLGSIGYMKKK